MADVRCPRCGAVLPRHYPPCRATMGRTGMPTGAPSAERIARMTQTEVGRILGLSRARVQQIETAALRKLRAGLAAWRPEG
jgi:hypothetical protein